ncbi:type 1 glutamine amidotransferase domain-containing protein [Belliella marina]|uniref:Type 1 glutamine amidotransferase domain-containing protein n=1 Tax=Belliella marina TaxID=1644146 RepID=A0ABW4VR97_9BACT
MENLKNKKVAILATNGFEMSELVSPLRTLQKNGAKVDIIAPKLGKIKGWENGDWAESVEVDKALDEVTSSDYDALVLPGGTLNPDKLRMDKKAINFIKTFFDDKKIVAAICHGPQLLIDAEAVENRKLTSFHSIKKDLENAGASWVDEEVVVDQGLITSRTPEDLSAFNRALVEHLTESDIKEEVFPHGNSL